MTNQIPQIIVALHLPEPQGKKPLPMSYLEDFVYQNMLVFKKGGVPAVKLQDQTPTNGTTRPETIAIMSALGKMIRTEFPEIDLGIIVESHDAYGPIAIAHAVGASFVRIKVFVGAMLKAGGIQEGCGVDADDFRHLLGSEKINILADVHDRVGYPILPVSITHASQWAVRTGADALILTGKTFQESLEMITTVKQAGINRPILLGGSANEENIGEILSVADGVIVSSAFKKDHLQKGDLVYWDEEKIIRFMDKVRQFNANNQKNG